MAEYIIKINDNDETDSDGGKRVEEMHRLVRCKDCRWGEPTKNCYGEDRIICGNDDTYIDRYITVPADWFCADGERKEGDGDADGATPLPG